MAVKSKEEILEGMNAAAVQAEDSFKEIQELFPDAVKTIAGWMKLYRPTAGFKRLGKIILGEDWRKSKGGE